MRDTGIRPCLRKKLTCRSFIKNSFRLSCLAFPGVGFAGQNNLTTRQIVLPFLNLPDAFCGFRAVQIPDLHASFWVGKTYLDQVIDRVNALPKDLAVIAGDIMAGSVNDFWKRWLLTSGGSYIPMVIESLNRLRDGPKPAVLGNHDQWDGRETELRLVNELERIGVGVLRNRSEIITRGKIRW